MRHALVRHQYIVDEVGEALEVAQHHFQLRYIDQPQVSQAELPHALPVSVVGLAFRDFEHNRGSKEVGTPWELHPAEVTVQ